MIFRSVKYGTVILLIICLLIGGSFGCFADKKEYSWEQWLEDEVDDDINNAMTFDEMETVYSGNRYEMRINGDNGVFYLVDKSRDIRWRSNPEGWEQESMVSGTAKEGLNAQIILKCYSESEKQFITLNSYSHSCKKGGFSYKKNSNGYTATYEFKNYDISISIDFEITEQGLSVALLRDKFSDTKEYRVFEVSVLPYFLSAERSDSGYMFIPDGTGAIINLNNNKTKTEAYSGHIYGEPLNSNRFLNNNATVLLPVYALCKNGNTVMAVIEQGDALGTVKASVAGQVNDINSVYATFTLRSYAFYDAGAYGSTDFDVFEKGKIKQDIYKTAYYFLGEGENNYYDIAKNFKKIYIKDEGEKSYNAVIDILGATRKIKSVLGIPVTQTQVMTDTKQLTEIVDALNSGGASDIAVKYSGIASSELKSSVYSSLKIDKRIGSIKKLDKLGKSLTKQGNRLYLSYNPVKFQKGMFTSSKNISRDLLGQFVTLNTYRPSGVVDLDAIKTVLLKPDDLLDMTAKIGNSVEKCEFGLAPLTITSEIYTDYSKASKGAHYTVDKYCKALEILSKSNGVMGMHTSFFALPYSEINTDIPISSSNFDLFDASVPFYEIVLSGKTEFTYKSLNYFSDVNTAFLKCIETGATPKYSLYYNSKSHLRDSISTDWFNGNFAEWQEQVTKQIGVYKNFVENIGDLSIESHIELASGVYKTDFASGKSVIVNYNESDFEYGAKTVPAGDFAVLEKE